MVEVTKLDLGQFSEASFCPDLNFRFYSRDADVAMKFILGRDSGLVWSRFLSLSFVEMVMLG